MNTLSASDGQTAENTLPPRKNLSYDAFLPAGHPRLPPPALFDWDHDHWHDRLQNGHAGLLGQAIANDPRLRLHLSHTSSLFEHALLLRGAGRELGDDVLRFPSADSPDGKIISEGIRTHSLSELSRAFRQAFVPADNANETDPASLVLALRRRYGIDTEKYASMKEYITGAVFVLFDLASRDFPWEFSDIGFHP